MRPTVEFVVESAADPPLKPAITANHMANNVRMLLARSALRHTLQAALNQSQPVTVVLFRAQLLQLVAHLRGFLVILALHGIGQRFFQRFSFGEWAFGANFFEPFRQ